jgi:hypothetical protein
MQVIAGVQPIMKPICLTAVLVVFVAGCASAGNQTAQPGLADADTYILHSTNGATPGDATSKPPRLTVGTSYPDTQLILPWFLNDIINFINYR